MRGARVVALAAAAAAVLALPAGSAAAARRMPGCAQRPSAGGDWPTYGHDAANTRFQGREKAISPREAAMLSPVWTFSTPGAGGSGDITGTPIETGGCVYVATSGGDVFAVNADTGKLVWGAKLPKGGTPNASVGIAARRCGKLGRRCGTVFVAASRTRPGGGCPRGERCIGPYVVALDQATGRLVWASQPIDTQRGADVFGSPVFAGRTLMIGISASAAETAGDDERFPFQGAMVFVDTDTGRVVRKTWTIHPPNRPRDRYAGGTIWSTPAIDRKRRVAFVGTSNPFQPRAEHPHTNAVLKFDVDRRHKRSFGRIVSYYKGSVEEFFPSLSKAPCFDVPGNPPPYYPQGAGSCGDMDLDFGAAPNLIRGPGGRTLVGAGQKSGVYHVFDARTMRRVRTQLVGPPSSFGGIVGSTAYDGRAIYGPVTAPGYLWSIAARDASLRWIGPVADGAHWGPPVAVANGVVYTVDLTGFLDAYDARTGVLLAKRPLEFGGTRTVPLTWGGVSVARNTIYAAVGLASAQPGYVVAFRPGGARDVPGDVQETGSILSGAGGTGGIGGGAGAAVVAGPGATYTGYATRAMATSRGAELSFVNLDAQQHDVTSDATRDGGRPLFASRRAGIGQVVPVSGLDRLQPGRSYRFHCSLHPGMRGTLVVR
jgi:polyvinyl alcohol dehydrogenase (cytochrome)